jgi:sec-independent protein translocase protein TatB
VPQIGPLEILLVAVIALIVLGPEKLPDMARKVGRTASELRRIANEAREEFRADFDLGEEDDEPPSRARGRYGAGSEEESPGGNGSGPAEAGSSEAPGDADRGDPEPSEVGDEET